MQQDDAFALLLELRHHRSDECVGLVNLEILRIDIDREGRDVAFGEMSLELRRLTQLREAEERRDRRAGHHGDGADAFLDFVGGFLSGARCQVLVRPGMRAHGMAGCDHLLQHGRMPGGVFANRKEHRLHALRAERGEHGGRRHRPWAVVECQHHFAGLQKIIIAILRQAEAGAAGGVDLDGTRHAERIGIVADGLGDGRALLHGRSGGHWRGSRCRCDSLHARRRFGRCGRTRLRRARVDRGGGDLAFIAFRAGLSAGGPEEMPGACARSDNRRERTCNDQKRKFTHNHSGARGPPRFTIERNS